MPESKDFRNMDNITDVEFTEEKKAPSKEEEAEKDAANKTAPLKEEEAEKKAPAKEKVAEKDEPKKEGGEKEDAPKKEAPQKDGKEIQVSTDKTETLGHNPGFFRKYFGGVGQFMPFPTNVNPNR